MTYRAPCRELGSALKTAGLEDLLARGFPDLDAETVAAILEAAGDFAADVLAPLNRAGDRDGARYAEDAVTAPAGFAEAYGQFAAGGWNGLAAAPAFGGQGLPKAVELAVFEMVHSANMAFGLCPMLTLGAIEALTLHGTARQKALVLPKLVAGAWTGTMNLTEPQAGSDLAALTSRAEPDAEGGWRLFGEKQFITWGDHDMAENICHLVLARAPEAPRGVKGLSLFLASKHELGADGALGARNRLRPGSIERKLGIHGSPTCVMLFEGASAELVGELGQGVAQMFVMMNAARLQVGVQGVAIAERAFQQALAYAQGRRQGRSAWTGAYPAPIYDHPDVRRTLALMKAKIVAGRGMCLETGVLADLARCGEDDAIRAAAQTRQELLTPIAKAWCTDMGVEVASAAVQVHGGLGFVEDTGVAQHYRDARIAPIYEGTNGIQAIDLVSRKLSADGGQAMRQLCAEIHATSCALADDAQFATLGRRLAAAAVALEAATEWQLKAEAGDRLAVATPYLQLAGDAIGGWVLARQAMAFADAQTPQRLAHTALAGVYATHVLAPAPGLADGLMEPTAGLAGLQAEGLAD
jgi:alkylation response protein AidB-like acyl-CoA dehydrogenase